MYRNLWLCAGLALAKGMSGVIAQPDHYCGTDKLHLQLMESDPTYVVERQKLDAFTQQYTKQHVEKKGTVYVIPIVFHVIHNFGSENVSKQRILDGLRIINEDFRKLNPDTGQIVSAFKGIAADSEIEFRLAQKDPDGNCTDGITRTVSSQTMSAGDGVKNLVRWPNDRYLNVWLVNSIASGAGGYAYYPGASPSIDGIVLRAGQFGPGNRSLSHEIGHYLNLAHTWGSANDPGVASNCSSDDGVSDTPNTIGNTSCDLTGMTCSSLDNVQNYMEYAFCERMFTKGQKTRMRAALNSPAGNRNNLWTPSNLALTGTDGPDYLCNVDFSADRHVVCVGSTVKFKDESYNGQNDWSWYFEGGTPNASDDANPVITYNAPGVYDVNLSVTNGSDVLIESKPELIVVQAAGEAMPFYESFEGFDLSEEINWEVINGDEEITWEVVDYAGYTGTGSLKMDNYSGNGYGRSDFLISPSLDLSAIESADLSFKAAFARKIDTTKDVLRVYTSTNCGASWALIYVKSSSSLATVSTTSSPFTPTSAGDWQGHSVSLNPASLVNGFKFKIEYLHKGGNNLYLDDINITGSSLSVPMLVAPLNGMKDQVVNTTVDWNAVDNVDMYEYQVDSQADFMSPGLISGTHDFISVSDLGTDTEQGLVNLQGNTTYFWRVRTFANSSYSDWSAIWEFTTKPVEIGITEDELEAQDVILYPNPTGGEAVLEFRLPKSERVEISIFDAVGQKILDVYSGTVPGGVQLQKIQGETRLGSPGIYIVRIAVGDQRIVKKLVVK